jgi:hypothetical protein
VCVCVCVEEDTCAVGGRMEEDKCVCMCACVEEDTCECVCVEEDKCVSDCVCVCVEDTCAVSGPTSRCDGGEDAMPQIAWPWHAP